MSDRPKDFMLNTLKGKVLLAVATLAVFNCVVGLIVFVGASFLSSNELIPVVATVASSAATTLLFAWWMSVAFLRPIDKLTLLAKGIERSPGMSLPKTTGSYETDELLQTISRTSHQLVNFIDLMDDVTAGKTDAAVNPLEHSDRISSSFQKLVAKVTDSIDAKNELESLQYAVNQVSSEVTGLQRGELLHVRTNLEATKPITDAFRTLIDRQAELTRVLHINSAELRNLTAEGKKRIRLSIEKNEVKKRNFKKLAGSVNEANANSDKNLREISKALGSINTLLDQLNDGAVSSAETTKSLTTVRKQFDATIHKLQNVGEQSLAIAHVSKSVQDLARRSNMIALNASIRANTSDQSSGLSTLTQEMSSLSDRAEKANKAIAGISDSVVRDVNEAYASLQWVASEFAKTSAQAAKDGKSVAKILSVLTELSELPSSVEQRSLERSAEFDRIFKALDEYSTRSNEMSAELQLCEENYLLLLQPIESLRDSVAPRKQILSPIEDRPESHATSNTRPQQAASDAERSSDLLELQGEN